MNHSIYPNSHQMPSIYADRLIRYLNREELLCLWHVARWTLGIRDRDESPSLPQITGSTGLDIDVVRETLDAMIQSGIFEVMRCPISGDFWYYLQPEMEKIDWQALRGRSESTHEDR